MIICVNGGVPKADAGEELEQALEAIYATLPEAPGFISSHDCVSEEGEEINILRFETEDDLVRWRDQGLHGSYQAAIARFYESFWIQTAEVHREYIWRDGVRTDGDLSWLFRAPPDPSTG